MVIGHQVVVGHVTSHDPLMCPQLTSDLVFDCLATAHVMPANLVMPAADLVTGHVMLAADLMMDHLMPVADLVMDHVMTGLVKLIHLWIVSGTPI